MARPKKTETKTIETDLSMALDTPVERTIESLATELEIDEFELRDRLCELVGNVNPLNWETLPLCHEPLLEQFKRGLEATASTRKLPAAELPSVAEIPELPEEPQPKKSKPKSTALTEKKTEAIKETRQAATQTNAGISETLTLLQAQQGLIDSSQAGTAYLSTYTANLVNVKGEGLTVIAAQMLQEISQKSGFDPTAILQQVGVPLTPETQQKLQETMGQVLGKAQAASTEIQQTSWGNGYDLQSELGHLSNLMNCTD